MQRAAADAVKDGVSKSAVSVLARLGKSGKFKGNIERDLHRKLYKEMRLPVAPCEVDVPRFEKASGKVKVPCTLSLGLI